ncbi:MAG: RNA ligase family protein, partial [Desulfomonilaceae bacterium]
MARIDLRSGKYYIEEKVDGSQFRFGIVGGAMAFGSHNIDYNGYTTDKMFTEAITRAEAMLKNIQVKGDTVFFAEYLQKPHHNALHYARVPQNSFYLFDVMVDGAFVSPEEVIRWAERLG